LESNDVQQKKRENSKLKRDVLPENKQTQVLKSGTEKTSAMLKQSVKTSGIEDNYGRKEMAS